MNAPLILSGPRVVVRENPIGGQPVVLPFPAGVTVAEVVRQVPLEHEAIRFRLDVHIDGVFVDRSRWGEPLAAGMIVSVHLRLGGGGGGRARKVLTAVAAIALIGGTLASGGLLAPLLGAGFAAGTTGATLLGAGLAAGGIAASLLAQGLAVPVTPGTGRVERVGFAAATNEFTPNSPLQRPLGTRRIFPNQVQPPFTERVGKDQFVTSTYAIAGQTIIDRVEVDEVDTEDMEAIEVEIGTSESPLDLLETYTRIEDGTATQISEWKTDPDDADTGKVEIDGTEAEAAPSWHRFETKNDVDAFRLDFVMPNLHYKNASSLGLTMRVRFRRRVAGVWDAWVNIPEIVIRGFVTSNPVPLTFRIDWVDSYPAEEGNDWPPESKSFGKTNGWASMFTHADWASTLGAASGDGFVGFEWVDETKIVLYLLTGTYPKGRYQFEVKRSWPFPWSRLNTSTYLVDPNDGGFPATVSDFYISYLVSSTRYIPFNPAQIGDDIICSSRQNRWNEYPITADGESDTIIVVRAKNRQVGRVAAVCAPLVEDWIGGAWVPGQRTDNPAALHRHVLTSRHLARPTPLARIDSPSLQEWHEWSAANGKRCTAVAQGRSVLEVLSLVDIAGWAVPKLGATYGVVIDRPRPDGPVNIISHRNAFGFRFRKEFIDRPHALRVQYPSEDDNGEVRELIVYDEGYNADGADGLTAATIFETISYESIPTEALATARGEHDLAAAKYRAREVFCNQDLEYLENSQGDLVLLETDVIGRQGGRGRVAEIILNTAGEVAGLVLDEKWNFDYADSIGADRGVAIRLHDSTVVVHQVVEDDSDPFQVMFSTPFEMPTDSVVPDLIRTGSLVVMGPLDSEAREMIVRSIRPARGRRAALTLVDYAAAELYDTVA